MPRHRLLTLLFLLLLSTSAFAWTTVGDGIEYQSFTTSDPNNLFVARMRRSNLNATIDATIANFKAAGARETVRNQAARYDDELNWWGQSYGQRNKVVVAINGDFFNLTTGLMTGGSIHGGWYVKRFTDFGGSSGFAWTVNRDLFIGDCVRHLNDRQYVTFLSSGNTIRFRAINAEPATDTMSIFTPQYDTDTNTADTVTEVLVELTRPLLIAPAPTQVLGTIRQVRVNQGSTPIPFGHVVLSANGAAASSLAANAVPGEQIGISQEITSCSGVAQDWTKTYASVGTNFTFLRNGVTQSTSNTGLIIRNPRTAIAYNDEYVFFVVCDGRNPGVSVGMNMEELAAFCRGQLAATWGANMDGGGSSTMVVNGVVMNDPSDGSERPVSNGAIMLNLYPKSQSAVFAAGQTVRTTASANLRLGPSTNYGVRVTLPNGSQGTVLAHELDGILAKGYNWWRVQFGAWEGWMAESLFAPSAQPGTVTVTDQGKYTPATEILRATWTPAADNGGSGINRYEYAVGTSPSAQNIRGWTSVGLATSVTATGLNVTTGNTYYIQVRAVNNLGVSGVPGVSDGISVPPTVNRIGEAWSRPDGSGLAMYTKVITRGAPGAFWLEETDRSAALRVVSPYAAVEAGVVKLAGVLGPSGAGRAMFPDVVEGSGYTTPVTAVGMRLQDLGGSSVNAATPGVAGAISLYNLGMLVRCRGVVTGADSSQPADRFFYIDDGSGMSDGSGSPGVKVRCGALPPPSGWVTVTGVVTSETAPAGVAPVLVVIAARDISPI